MRPTPPLVLIASLAFVLPADAQETTPSATNAPRHATVLAGAGNSMGWLGFRAGYYLSGGRISAFGGLGLSTNVGGNTPGVTFAAGARGYTPGFRHRGFVELSVSQVLVEEHAGILGATDNYGRYGPGLQVGYQFAAAGGLTIDASVGIGYGIGTSDELQPWQPLLGLGVGYTFR